MKKIFGALMIAICIAMAMPAQAQIHFGVKGGLNLSKASFSNVSENFKKDNFTGFFIGPMAEFNIPIVGLGVDASLLFAQRGSCKQFGQFFRGHTCQFRQQHIPCRRFFQV